MAGSYQWFHQTLETEPASAWLPAAIDATQAGVEVVT
jgi:hypothetical protein